MKAILSGLVALSLLAGMAAASSGPAENDYKAVLTKHWQISKEFTSEAFANAAGTEALAQPSGTDKKTAIKFLADSFDRCVKDFEAMTPAQLNRMVDIGAGRQAMAIEVLWWAFTDTAHHRGQAEVYLRVKNIKPPRYVF